MSRYDDQPERSEAVTASLPRTSSTADFSKLFSKRRNTYHESQGRRSLSSARSSDGFGSENSQVLYMASRKKTKDRDRSLSCISNGSNRRLDGSSDTKHDKNDEPKDEASWNIIDREIFEWQHVCQTGRPYWWSPEAKYTRIKKPQPRLTNESGAQKWLKDLDERPKPAYGIQRRTVSDSFLSDPNTVHDLAHLVAIQLLGACFTLPPDSLIGLPSPNYGRKGKSFSGHCPDPRMISSLRMHTNFRYSPSFGHEPRNPSPVQHWGPYDGPSRASSPSAPDTGTVSPDIGTSGSPFKRSRVHRRPLHVTEGSGSRGSDDEEARPCCREGLGSTKTVWRRLSGNHEATSKSNKNRRGLNSKSVTHSVDFASASRDNREGIDGNRPVQTSQHQPNMNYRLQPTIRSEPHPVFVQPVRELVVKRWRSFRRRFGGSLHSALPTNLSDYPTSGSESGASGVTSPILSSDAKGRRRRARERGEIHSSSVDSTPHYNSPASEIFTANLSGRVSPYSMDHSISTTLAHTPKTISSPAIEGTPSMPSGLVVMEKSLPSELTLRGLTQQTSSVLANCGSSPSISEIPSSKSVSPTPSHSYSTRKAASRKRRQSMLSEVCTPEDFATPASVSLENTPSDVVERGHLSAVGSTLVSPIEEKEAPLYPETSIQGRQSSSNNLRVPDNVSLSELKGQTTQERPPMSRTSSSGTQVFTPGSDGVEIDGLPTGPDRNRWARTGGRRERTYLL